LHESRVRVLLRGRSPPLRAIAAEVTTEIEIVWGTRQILVDLSGHQSDESS